MRRTLEGIDKGLRLLRTLCSALNCDLPYPTASKSRHRSDILALRDFGIGHRKITLAWLVGGANQFAQERGSSTPLADQDALRLRLLNISGRAPLTSARQLEFLTQLELNTEVTRPDMATDKR